MPDPSLRFEPGQCRTLTPRSAMSACSRVVTQTQCAAHSRGVASPVSARYSRLVRPPESRRTTSTSSRDSMRACGRARDCCAESAATASSSSREHDTAKRGAKAARKRPLPAPCQRRCNADALVDRRRVRSLQARRHLRRRSPSCTSRRSPACRMASSASNTTSVSCTVSIVKRRRGAGEEQLGCGEACRGTERRRRVRGFERPHAPPQPVEERKIVGEGSKERLAQVDVRLHESREHVAAARIDDVVRWFFGPAN